MRGRAKIQSRSAFDLVNAQDALARSRPADAQRLINRVAEIAKEELPSPRVLVEINLTSALVAIYNADGPLALASAEMALTQLQAGQERWSTADRSYLIAYAQALIAYCEDWRDGGPALRHAHVKDLDLNQVSGHLKQKFPMPSSGAFGLKLDKVQPWRASA